MTFLTILVFLPTLGALVIAFLPSKKDEDGVNEKENQNLLLGATLTVGVLTFLVSLVGLIFMNSTALLHKMRLVYIYIIIKK